MENRIKIELFRNMELNGQFWCLDSVVLLNPFLEAESKFTPPHRLRKSLSAT